MIDTVQYNNRLLELSTTLGARVNNVISTQARPVVSEVFDIANIMATQSDLRILADVTNSQARQTKFKSIIAEKYATSNVGIIWVGVTVNSISDVVTVKIKTDVRLYASPTDFLTISTDSSFAVYSQKITPSYNSLKQHLSGILSGPVGVKFPEYLSAINQKLTASGKLKIERLLVGIFDEIDIPNVDGGILSSDQPDTVTTPPNPTAGVTTPNVPNTSTSGNTTPPQDTSGKTGGSPKNFLDIEAVDSTNVSATRDKSGFISVTIKEEDDSDILTRTNRISRPTKKSTQQLDTQNVSNNDNQPTDTKPTTPDKNNTVVTQERNQNIETTEAQRRAESSDAILKSKVKTKNLSAPLGANIALQTAGGILLAKDAIEQKPATEKKSDVRPVAKTFIEWMNGDGKDKNGIVYRGASKTHNYPGSPSPRPKSTFGMVERRYKNLFNFGQDLSAIFSGITIESPIDVALAMNTPMVGRYNKNWPYMFGEGSEIHASILLGEYSADKASGGIGTAPSQVKHYLDANWAENPYWCGIFTDFILYNNGVYKSDGGLESIVGTAKIVSLYNASPFNVPPKHISKKKRKALERRLDELNSNTTETTSEAEEIQRKLKGAETINKNNTCAIFKMNDHWTDNGMTTNGLSVIKELSDWPGGYIVRRHVTGGHVETLLHISSKGAMYTIGGNTAISGASISSRNGSQYGFKKYNSMKEFCGSSTELYIYKRGVSKPYTNGIGNTVKRTKAYDKYVKDLDTDTELGTDGYNILRDIMEM